MTDSQLDYRWAALVPMRHHSERVPGKNYRPLAGKPLYAYIIETLLAVEAVELIVVNTDSEVIWDGIEKAYPQVKLIERPAELRDGEIPMNQVLLHDVGQAKSKFYLQTHSTNPLLKPATVTAAIERFEAAFPEKDSLFGVTRLQTRLWTPDGEPINHDPSELLRTQDLPPVYEENSCFYLFERDGFLARKNRLGSNPALFEVDADEAYDIDEEVDFRMVNCLVKDQRI
ncbi:MAG: cytidylyltransferase domain-containing protein [Anaerolineales bacterium]